MKLSIWQQFSSNHSSSYIVIGRFENVAIAKKNADILRDWLYRMLWGNDRKIAEDEIMAKYQMDWYENGIRWNGRPDDIDEVVKHLHSDVFLMCPVETWDSNRHFVELLDKMGSLGTIENQHGDGYSEGILVNIKCIAPKSSITNEVASTVKHLLDEEKKPYREQNRVSMPWAKYSPDFSAGDTQLTFTDYDQLEIQWLKDQMAWSNFYRANSVDSEGKVLPYNSYLWKKRERFITQDPKLNARIATIRDDIAIYDGTIRLDGETVYIEDIACVSIDIFLIAFVRWLESMRCTVEYSFQKRVSS